MSVYLKSGYNFAHNLLYSLPMKKYFLLSLLLFTFGSLAAQSNRTFIRSHLKNIAAQSNENVTIEIAAKRKGLKVKLTGAISNNSDEIYAGFLILVVMSNTNLDPEQDQVAKDIEIAYKVIEVTFGDNVGDAQDTYVLYIIQETKLIDQFLFTVKAFGVSDPFLMSFEYQTVEGIKIPS